MSIRGESRVVVAQDDKREQGYDNGRAIRDGVIVVAVVLVGFRVGLPGSVFAG